MRPSWHSGGEMGKWDRELIELLPDGIQVYASAGAGYDWVDVNLLAEHGEQSQKTVLLQKRCTKTITKPA